MEPQHRRAAGSSRNYSTESLSDESYVVEAAELGGDEFPAVTSRDLFGAVAAQDHLLLLKLFASHARSSLISHTSLQDQWNSWVPTSNRTSRSSAPYGDAAMLRRDGSGDSQVDEGEARRRAYYFDDEEEDDAAPSVAPTLASLSSLTASSSLAASSSTSCSSSRSSRVPRRSSSPWDSASASILSPFRPNDGVGRDPTPSSSRAAYQRLLRELAALVSDRAEEQYQMHDEGVDDDDGNKQVKNKKKIIEVAVETERVLRDAAANLAEMRPPPDLVVPHPSSNAGSNSNLTATSNSQHAGSSDGSAAADPAAAAPVRPPVFDGSVALATPPNPAAAFVNGGGGGGGSGTILHLACAVDSPLALAFLLAMGGDPASTHTAFRRMMVHEAACNGSYRCLHLLLELGHEFAAAEQVSAATKHYNNNNAAAAAAALSPATLMDHLDLPFLPRRMDRSDALAPLQLYMRRPLFDMGYYLGDELSGGDGDFNVDAVSPRQLKAKMAADDDDDDYHCRPRPNFVGILRLFRTCLNQVRNGSLSELDAARRVVKMACLDSESRATLARSCGFLVPSSAAFSSPPAIAAGSSLPSSGPLSFRTSFLWRARAAATAATLTGGRGHSRTTLAAAGRSGSGSINNDVGGGGGGGGGAAAADGHGNTPLHWSAFKNEVECVQLLLRFKANPNARASPSGWTPLHDAAYSDSVEAVSLLLDAGANVDARANSGATPLCFAAQEDASKAARLLLERGADLTARCADVTMPTAPPGAGGGRFSGYTPLHYCAHYNAHKAARVLLKHPSARLAMEVPDLSGRLPIHVAAARGSAEVLRELLHAGARVETRSPPSESAAAAAAAAAGIDHDDDDDDERGRRRRRRPRSAVSPGSAPSTPTRQRIRRPPLLPPTPERRSTPRPSSSPSGAAIVSSPVLRSMIPSQPVSSSKPWNCLTQRSIDSCRMLIEEAERPWAPDRHSLFTPEDRRAVVELLKVGKRLEMQGTGIHVQSLWPTVLSFCGRGWFQPSSLVQDGEGSDGASEDERSDVEGDEYEDDNNKSEMEYGEVNDGSLALPIF